MIEESELYRKLVDASTDGLWLLDGEGQTMLSNPRMGELLGRTPEQMERLSAYDVHDEDGKLQFAAHMERARAGDLGHHDLETMCLRLDGTPIWLLCSFQPIHDDHGATIGYLHRFSDYTNLRELIDTLEQREQQLAAAQAIAKIGSWEWDVVENRTTWSDELFRIYGIDPQRFRGDYEAFLEFIHPDDRKAVRDAVRATYDGLDEFEWTARVIRGDGAERWCRGLGRVERGPDGTPVRMNGTDQDITEQVKADHEIAEYTRRLGLLRHVADAANRSTSLVETLARALEGFSDTPGWEPAGVFVTNDDSDELLQLPLGNSQLPWGQRADPALARKVWASENLEHQPVPGHETSHSLVAFPVRHGGGIACIVQLVGDEVPPDEISRDLIDQMATQLGRVAERERAAAELAEARDQAMEASRLKSEFLATMSHEIRTPMNGVIGLTDLLMRTELDDQQRRLAEALHGAGSTLRGIINDILDLSKIEAGKLELELVDFEVRSVVEQTVRLLRGSANEKGLDLRLTVAPRVPTYVRGDAVRWEQVLTNLGSNAVKFTDRGSVEVAVDLVERTPDGVLLEVVVQDTGPGIALDARQRLFDAFTQADPSTTRRHGGTGLGLTIARQLVEALGGELSLHSEVGRGTAFHFTAAFGTATGDAREYQGAVEGSVPVPTVSQRVLVVEDNQVNQMVAVGLLEIAGYATEVAEDGVEAVTALEGDHGFVAVLMDCRMPRMDGYSATRAIRAEEPPGRRVPIIAVTASALEGERERCLESGMDDFLTKPVDSARLHRVLRQWISGARGARGDDAPVSTSPAVPPAAPAASTTTTSTPAAALSAEPGERGEIVDVSRIEMLHEMVKDGVSLFQRSSGNFIAHAQDRSTAIGAAVERGDADELTATAHKLKGSALNLGLPRVGAAASELEERGREGRLDGATAAYAALSREIGLAIAALEQERAARA
ncbi:MAG: PAS domain-containing protein [Nocardioides sp.]